MNWTADTLVLSPHSFSFERVVSLPSCISVPRCASGSDGSEHKASAVALVPWDLQGLAERHEAAQDDDHGHRQRHGVIVIDLGGS